MKIFEHIRITVRLNNSERYRERDDRDKVFIVEQITIGGNSQATLRGTAVKVDGTLALHDRQKTIPADQLPAFVSVGVLNFLMKGRRVEPEEN